MESIYYKDLTYQRQVELLLSSEMKEQDKQIAQKWASYLFNKVSEKRVEKLIGQFRRFCIRYDYSFVEKNKDKLTQAIAMLNRDKKLTDDSKVDYRRLIRQFYLTWYADEDLDLSSKDIDVRDEATKFYKYVNKTILRNEKQKQIDPGSIITDEDCEVLLDNCNHPIERALINFLHESGLRATELLTLRISDLVFKETHLVVNVPDGKTGRRVIYLSRCIPDLQTYLRIHPLRNNKDSMLWITFSTNWKNKPLKYTATCKMLQRIFKKAGITKWNNPHWFRHSRATILAPKMPEIMLCKFMGWTIGSKQARVYCHLSNEQLEETCKRINGIKTITEEEKKKTLIKCVCGKENPEQAEYCYNCFRPLKIENANEYQSELDKSIKLLMQIAQDPTLMKQFQQFKESQKSL